MASSESPYDFAEEAQLLGDICGRLEDRSDSSPAAREVLTHLRQLNLSPSNDAAQMRAVMETVLPLPGAGGLHDRFRNYRDSVIGVFYLNGGYEWSLVAAPHLSDNAGFASNRESLMRDPLKYGPQQKDGSPSEAITSARTCTCAAAARHLHRPGVAALFLADMVVLRCGGGEDWAVIWDALERVPPASALATFIVLHGASDARIPVEQVRALENVLPVLRGWCAADSGLNPASAHPVVKNILSALSTLPSSVECLPHVSQVVDVLLNMLELHVALYEAAVDCLVLWLIWPNTIVQLRDDQLSSLPRPHPKAAPASSELICSSEGLAAAVNAQLVTRGAVGRFARFVSQRPDLTTCNVYNLLEIMLYPYLLGRSASRDPMDWIYLRRGI